MREVYFAKSRMPNGSQPTVAEHLRDVAALAKSNGEVFGAGKEAELCGLLHDFGKYSECFQGVLEGRYSKIDHALCGAALLSMNKWTKFQPEIEVINGHHSGLRSAMEINLYLNASINGQEPVYCNDGKRAALSGKGEYTDAVKVLQRDFPGFLIPECRNAYGDTMLERMLFARMLFSCLVDADYSISAEEENPGYLKSSELKSFDPEGWLNNLQTYHKELTEKSGSDPVLNHIRNELYEKCGEMGEQPGGLFTLTAPTGTGKTLALLNFALRHCLAQNKRRIIFVLPFLTLAEQNADVYRKIIPDLLEDHSQKELPEEAREYAARWSAPAILTTSVKFFETLFAQRPTDCRKLHNIANSVIIFDEAQTLNPEVMTSTLEAVNALCRYYGCTVLFSTATQPDFGSIPGLEWKPREIMPDFRKMYDELRRTKVDWRLSAPVDLSEIAAEMASQGSVCAIVNLKKHARKLYEALSIDCDPDSVFFISTNLCPAHRSLVVKKIHERLENKLPCRVVSTQCIEAGVDLDFEVMYRALAPLDSIIQAAGRCNRNGNIHAGGKVVVFIPNEEGVLYPGNWYENAALLVLRLNDERKNLQVAGKDLDIHSPDDITFYYHELFSHAKDKEKLCKAIENKKYLDVAKEYRLISSQGLNIIVPYEDDLKKFEEIRDEAWRGGMTHKLMREAAGITVSTYIKREELLHWAEPVFLPLKYGEDVKQKNESGYYILLPQCCEKYTDDMGLQLDKENDEVTFI